MYSLLAITRHKTVFDAFVKPNDREEGWCDFEANELETACTRIIQILRTKYEQIRFHPRRDNSKGNIIAIYSPI